MLDHESYEITMDALQGEGIVLKDQNDQPPPTSTTNDKYFISEAHETFSRLDGHSSRPTGASSTAADLIHADHLGETTIYTDQASTIYSDEVDDDHNGMNYQLAPKHETGSFSSSETLVQTGI